MKGSKGRRWALGFAVVAVLSVCAGVVVSRERIYELWQVHRLRTDGWPAARSAAQWLSENGSPASLPVLIDLLETVKDEATPRPAESGEQIMLVNASLARHEAKCLSVLGSYLREREGRTPKLLVDLLEDALSKDRLSSLNAPALFADALAGKEKDVRLWGAECLELLGPASRPAAAALHTALLDSDPIVRAHAVLALLQIGSWDPRNLPALLKGLAEETLDTKEAVFCLSSWARTEPQVLEALLCRSEPCARNLALEVLWELDPSAATRAPSLPVLLADSAPGVSHSAAILLGRAGLELEATAPIILRLLDDPSGPLWRRALSALPSLGAAARPAVPALVRALKTLKSNEGEAAADALGRMGAVAVEAAPALLDMLRAPEMWRRRCAVRALPEIAMEGAPVIAGLEARLLDSAAEVRVCAAASMILLDPARRDDLQAVIQSALITGDYLIRQEAALALTRLGEVSRLVELALSDRDIQSISAQALQAGGSVDLAPLCRALQSKHERERRRAATFLAAFGTCAQWTAADLLQALADGEASVRAAAAAALGSIDPEPTQARPALEKAARDISQEVRLEAREALKKLRRRPQGERRP